MLGSGRHVGINGKDKSLFLFLNVMLVILMETGRVLSSVIHELHAYQGMC